MAIPQNIEELAHKVRTEIYGRDVREALATSMEATAEVAEWSREVAQQIIDGSFDEGELNTEIERKLNELEQQYAPRLTSIETEIEDARGYKPNLGDRLNEFSSQLAHIETQKAEKTALAETNAQLALKANNDEVRFKSVKLELEDMSEETLSAMTGGATVNVLSVPQNESVDRNKLSLELNKTIRKYLVPDLEWELGGVTSTGGDSTTNIRARTKYVILDAGTTISIKDSGYQIGYAKYDMNKVQTLNTNYLSGGATLDETTYYRIFIKKKDDSDLTNLLSYIDSIVEAIGKDSLLHKADKTTFVNNPLDANVKAIAHRGDTVDAPENTIPAFQKAKEKGFSYVECDVRFSSDGYPVLAHLNEVEGNPGVYVSDSTLSELRALDVGSWKSPEYAGTIMPTFKEFILHCKKNNLHPYIHIKTGDSTQIGGLATTVRRLGMTSNVTWACQSGSYATALTSVEPKARIGYMATDINETSISAINTLKTGENEVFFNVDYLIVDETKSNLALDNDFGLECYIVNDEAALRTLVDLGVTGITTDTLNIAGVLSE